MSNSKFSTAVRYDPFARFSRERAISLRWTLRDILANRTRFMSVADADVQFLVRMRMVEMRDGEPVLTPAGMAVIE